MPSCAFRLTPPPSTLLFQEKDAKEEESSEESEESESEEEESDEEESSDGSTDESESSEDEHEKMTPEKIKEKARERIMVCLTQNILIERFLVLNKNA